MKQQLFEKNLSDLKDLKNQYLGRYWSPIVSLFIGLQNYSITINRQKL